MRALGLSTFTLASPFTDDDADRFDEVREWGFDVIEVCVEDPERLSAPVLIEAAERSGLSVSICGAFGPGRDASSPEPAVRDAAESYLRSCVDLAAAVGSPHVAGPMYAPTGRARPLSENERRTERARAAATLGVVARYASDRGVSLAIEPLNRFETDLVNTVQQGLELIAEIGAENVGLMLDTFHMNIEEKSTGDAIRFAGDRVFHVQVSENDRGTPGTGQVRWSEVWRALDDIGYGGAIVIESFLPDVVEIARAVSLWRPWAPSMETLARDGLAFLRTELG